VEDLFRFVSLFPRRHAVSIVAATFADRIAHDARVDRLKYHVAVGSR
jgi:hypothetical protein